MFCFSEIVLFQFYLSVVSDVTTVLDVLGMQKSKCQQYYSSFVAVVVANNGGNRTASNQMCLFMLSLLSKIVHSSLKSIS